MILCEPLCLGVFVAGKDLSEWTQTIKTFQTHKTFQTNKQ